MIRGKTLCSTYPRIIHGAKRFGINQIFVLLLKRFLGGCTTIEDLALNRELNDYSRPDDASGR